MSRRSTRCTCRSIASPRSAGDGGAVRRVHGGQPRISHRGRVARLDVDLDRQWKEIEGANWAHPRGPKRDVQAKQGHPVTCVSWHDDDRVLQVGRRAAARPRRSGRRLLAAQMAASGHGEIGSRTTGCATSTCPWVTRRRWAAILTAKSPYGLLDMAGNVWEWTSSLWGKESDKPEFGYPAIPNMSGLVSRASIPAAIMKSSNCSQPVKVMITGKRSDIVKKVCGYPGGALSGDTSHRRAGARCETGRPAG